MMIGVDTNILVRAFLDDDKKQSVEAKQFLETKAKHNQLFISSYAILEFVWVLKVKKIPRETIYNAVITLCDSSGIQVGNLSVILTALERYKKGKADFGDYMILAEGSQYKASSIKTFDQALLRDSTGDYELNQEVDDD